MGDVHVSQRQIRRLWRGNYGSSPKPPPLVNASDRSPPSNPPDQEVLQQV
ncbi:hypothetical protein [Coleofasciculus sp. F4-SAH-05]